MLFNKKAPQKQYALDSDFVTKLDREILAFINKGLDNDDEEAFNRIALKEFKLQFQTIKPYRDYCLCKGMTPEQAKRWQDIPAVPSKAFKEFVLATFPVEKAEHAYFTSGTTNPVKKGKIYRDPAAVALINAANGLLTRTYVFPDQERMKIMLMTPSPKMAPGIGMAVGLERVRTEFGTPDSDYLISFGGLNLELLLQALIDSEKTGSPLALIGSTPGFIFFFKACQREGISFKLPKGSRICDGGGYMGQFGECSKEEYFAMCNELLGIEEHFCINVLGMGEVSTNFFDNSLHDRLAANPAERHKVIPPWTRTEVVDVDSFEVLPKGEIGLLKHYDLANRSMVMAVQTDNLGFETEDGFEIVGRWKKRPGTLEGEEIRGTHGGKIMTQMIEFLLKRNLKKLGAIYGKLSKTIGLGR
ncbi:MAG: hypothetical protein OEY01_08145 [Desulfobulbaceae bacterium]|nr:hypothetical protein [Desulfobulbaceae bacterium]